MARIKAKGKYLGNEREVEVHMEDGSPIIETDYGFDERMQERFNELLKDAPAIGGTYYPDSNSMLAALSVLESAFFDEKPTEIEVEGDIGTIPTEDKEDIVY